MTLDMPHCRLAYLSACESAVNIDRRLREEGLHLAGALQMAAIPNVVATYWSILDDKAVEVAGAFYKTLIPQGYAFVVDGCKAARSLHAAVKKLRTTEVDLYVWGAYIHYGC
jgi:CHAT domain-containing protein